MNLRHPTRNELDGLEVYGDDFTEPEIDKWFADEAEAYVELYASNPSYEYEYESVNVRHGFRHLGDRRFRHVLGLGSAYGDELGPIADRIDHLTIIESSKKYEQAPVLDIPIEWIPAQPCGDIAIGNAAIDLTVCFGVLHHIPNVGHVINEVSRVTAPGGFVLIREPIISMGDFTRPRPGLTPHERGIPHKYLMQRFSETGFEVLHSTPCFFSLTSALGKAINSSVYSSSTVVRADQILSSLFQRNTRYTSRTAWQKVRPTSRFYVLRREFESTIRSR